MSNSLYSHLRASIRASGAGPAILGVRHRELTHAHLLDQIDSTIETLNALGVGRGDRVAIALPNGPEAAVCILSVACTATAAPLNPASTQTEFQAALTRLKPKALIVDGSSRANPAAIASLLGIDVIRLMPDPEGSVVSFRLEGRRQPGTASALAEPDDVALLMHTSGSTSRPKLAPLTHRNIFSGAMNNIAQLGLGPNDRCLCVTGLFYTQGILVSVLSSLLAGGGVVCTPGYDPVRFFEWLDQFHPTWYAAPVSVQQSILTHAADHSAVIEGARLRVIRCSSANASPDLIAKVEAMFRAPMLDSYGLTETGSTVVGEPLPPGTRKRGSVGKALGCEIGIMDQAGNLQEQGATGEVVVRGPTVIRAYDADPEVNRDSFHGEWLRTGDLGRLDPDGYLFLTGRIKEIINRGGEKISPVEIDEVLNAHPAVAEAVAFSIPDATLGEEIGAAVVVRNGAQPGEKDLWEFAAARLAPSKVPRRFVFVSEIPRAPTGKFLRIGLAAKLGITEASKPGRTHPPAQREDRAAPVLNSPTMLLLHIWEDVLGKAPIGTEDDFFELGGDSLLGARLISRVEETFGKRLTMPSLFEAPTVARMARLLTSSPEKGYDFGGSRVITIRESGSLPPLFLLDPHPVYRHLILELPRQIPVFGLTFPNPAGLSVPFRLEEIAEQQVAALRGFRPHGPYALVGWCATGVLAYEVARILEAAGEEVSVVTIIDAFNPARWQQESRWGARGHRMLYHLENLSMLGFRRSVAYIRDRMRTLVRKLRRLAWRAAYRLHLVTDRRVGDRFRVPDQILSLAISDYRPGSYTGRVLLIRAERRPSGTYGDPARGWRKRVADLRVGDVPGNHIEMFTAKNVQVMASLIAEQLKAAETSDPALALRS